METKTFQQLKERDHFVLVNSKIMKEQSLYYKASPLEAVRCSNKETVRIHPEDRVCLINV